MNIKKCITALFGVLMLATVTPDLVQAQWSIGASYEIREEAPKNGFGARVEREILKGLPLVNLSLRAHFSYFSDENQITVIFLPYFDNFLCDNSIQFYKVHTWLHCFRHDGPTGDVKNLVFSVIR